MADTPNKGFSFRKLFFRDVDTSTPSSQPTNQNPSLAGEKTVLPFNPVTNAKSDASIIEDFVQRLHNLINQNNQSGFDFVEFTESLFEETQNPDAGVYRTVFRIAQKMDTSLTAQKLIQSADYYKNLVQTAADNEIAKGNTKMGELNSLKETEKSNLTASLASIRDQINQLNQQINSLQQKSNEASNNLMQIDEKYNSQFQDIAIKLDAIKQAKEQVMVSIVDIQAGINAILAK